MEGWAQGPASPTQGSLPGAGGQGAWSTLGHSSASLASLLALGLHSAETTLPRDMHCVPSLGFSSESPGWVSPQPRSPLAPPSLPPSTVLALTVMTKPESPQMGPVSALVPSICPALGTEPGTLEGVQQHFSKQTPESRGDQNPSLSSPRHLDRPLVQVSAARGRPGQAG